MNRETLPAQGQVDVNVSHLVKFTPMDYDPFEGDFGDQGDIVFSDAMVKARKTHTCTHCGGDIGLGELHRSRYEKSNGEMMTFRWCAECCAAMVAELEAEYAEDKPEDRFPFECRHEQKCESSYAMADAMLAERSKRPS